MPRPTAATVDAVNQLLQNKSLGTVTVLLKILILGAWLACVSFYVWIGEVRTGGETRDQGTSCEAKIE